jgi:hypothetical protein
MKIEFDPLNCSHREAVAIIKILAAHVPISYMEKSGRVCAVEGAYLTVEGVKLLGVEKVDFKIDFTEAT